MSPPPRALRIAVVSPDTAILHDLSWMLTAVGYTVVTSRELDPQAAWRRFSDTDFVVFDGRSIADPTPATLAHHADNPIYRLFLYDPSASTDLTAWFAAGANDALRVPVSRGELLVRLRAGARLLEFERRMGSQSSQSRLPGMYSKRGLLRKLSRFSTSGESVTLGHTLLTTSIDFFAGICREEGEAAAWALLATLATSIEQSVGDNAIAACLDNGTFHIVLPGRKVAAARDVADQIAQAFRTAQVDREPGARLSLTTAIVPWRVGVAPERLLEQGQETLAVAQQSGGDCAMEQDAFAQELACWQNEFTAGSPFANVIAQDIMEPFPFVLQRHTANEAMLVAARRSGAPVWPFVDRDGRLVGVARPAPDTAATQGWDDTIEGSPALVNPVTIAHDVAFPEIYEAFSTQGCPELVVVADQRPIGYVTFDGFISLIEPIHSATFVGEESALEDSRSLLIGSLMNGSEQGSDSDQ